MNIIFEKKHKNKHIAIAEISDEHEILFSKIKSDLSFNEIERYKHFKNNKRKEEWLSVRLLLKKILNYYPEIKYNKYGKPFIETDKSISISHTKHYVSVILSNNKKTAIDIEIISDKILKTAKKFIYPNELKFFSEEDRVKKAYLNWCCKETLFKIKEHGGYDFKKHFKVIDSELKQNGNKKTIISYNKNLENYCLNYYFLQHKENEILIVWF